MTCKYLGFDTLQMLTKLSDHYDRIEIETHPDGDKLLTLHKDGKVEKPRKGPLFAILSGASKPYVDQWKEEQKQFRDRLKKNPVGLFESLQVKRQGWADDQRGINHD